ncbi:MAG: ExbD/TolR family protein [Desulfovibrio sp.]|uniref:ExbD/TolR family protein n=1 Tax=Desulfovibrio sp. 7SRBS1 TaxID=3378064 RepID=UPI003B3EB973
MSFDYQSKREYMADINLTPLVDVVFVLLIIFMVTAPLMTQGVDVELPQTRTVKNLPMDTSHVVLSVKKDGSVFLDEYEVPQDRLEQDLKRLVTTAGKSLYLRADKQTPYGEVVRVMGEIKAAGIEKIGVVAEEDKKKSK